MKLQLVSALLAATAANAHLIVRSIYVNGVDQGTGVGIRLPGFVEKPGLGANSNNNSPVRDLDSIDLRCNILGDTPAPDTIKVAPGDTVTFEWGHRSREAGDQIIPSSHHGPGVVYISPDPPVGPSWVKIWEKGEYAKNKWFATGELVEKKGLHSLKIPNGLKPGYYLLRPELITLHEAEVSHQSNKNRGVQLYMACIQIEVTGNGNVALPNGVAIPGVYNYNDPGLVYNLYYTPPGVTYKIPGPTTWSGAATQVPNPTLGTKKGNLASITSYTRWILPTPSSMVYEIKNGQTVSSRYTATWPATRAVATPAP
ncbi:hypothetical protein BJ508DRAFT_119008 [Ascobolus immersus RN42]|uniref:AA9 family lytic polysaccharide monooxygenase n=1 Tax=Ascobolus immersus RN42 TaxID=1160509 RepID=A0A3N4ILU7_ASCIM|nr:hypothetical protein BJ508DRAFT_119008 [Ascobolus immersus RN42]